jgi:hypothetical protein
VIPDDFFAVLADSIWVIAVLAAAAAVGVLVMQNRKHRRQNR